jgi:hypothetical protein
LFGLLVLVSVLEVLAFVKIPIGLSKLLSFMKLFPELKSKIRLIPWHFSYLYAGLLQITDFTPSILGWLMYGKHVWQLGRHWQGV